MILIHVVFDLKYEIGKEIGKEICLFYIINELTFIRHKTPYRNNNASLSSRIADNITKFPVDVKCDIQQEAIITDFIHGQNANPIYEPIRQNDIITDIKGPRSKNIFINKDLNRIPSFG